MLPQDKAYSKLRFLLRYLEYRMKAVKASGLHSPFLFELYSAVISRRGPDPELRRLDALRHDLRKAKRTILYTPMGAHSGQQVHLKIGEIARGSGKSLAMVHLLYHLSGFLRPKTIIELGTSLGISTSYLAAGAGNATVVTMEGCPATAIEAKKHFQDAGLNHIQQIAGDFDKVFPGLLENHHPVDLLFLDGNHTREATLRYFTASLPHIQPSSVIIIDDIHWSPGMESAWEAIKHHPDVTVTVDLFHLGLVFFRKESSRENFVLK